MCKNKEKFISTPQSFCRQNDSSPQRGALVYHYNFDGIINMNLPRNKQNLNFAKELRKNMTKEEKHLWYDFLRICPFRFRRQELIGNYIADFYCNKAMLVIEIDGSQHYESDALEYDRKRTDYFNSLNIEVLRFTNIEVDKNFEGVCEAILLNLNNRVKLVDEK